MKTDCASSVQKYCLGWSRWDSVSDSRLMTDVPNYPVQAKLCETNDLFPSPERRVSWGSCYFEGRRKLALVAITGRLAEFLSIAARPRVSFAKERPDREREIKITQSSEVIAMDLL